MKGKAYFDCVKYLMTFSLFFCSIYCYGQKKTEDIEITIGEIAKVELNIRFMSNLKYELTPNANGNWECWQTQFQGYNGNGANSPKLIKQVPVAKLEELLTYFNRPDTSKNIKWFDLKYKDLVRNIDSIKWIDFTIPQRMEFMRVLANQDTLMAAINRVVARNEGTDSRLYNAIKLITKGGEEFLAESTFDGFPHQLPWKIKGLNIYDWRLRSLIYAFIGDEKQEARLKNYFYENIVTNIYYTNFQTSFNWANFQADYPGAAALTGLTLTPFTFSRWVGLTNGWFTSALLPGNWIIETKSFYPYHGIRRLKNAEQLIVAAYAKNKKGFDELKVKPSEILLFSIFGGDLAPDDGLYDTLEELKHRFPELRYVDEQQLILVVVFDQLTGVYSKKLLLQDGRLIVI